MEVIFSESGTVGFDWTGYEVPYALMDMFSQIMVHLLNSMNSDLQGSHASIEANGHYVPLELIIWMQIVHWFKLITVFFNCMLLSHYS